MEGSNTPSFPAQGRFSTQRRKRGNQSVEKSASSNPENGEVKAVPETVDTPMQNAGETSSTPIAGNKPSSVKAGNKNSSTPVDEAVEQSVENVEEPVAQNMQKGGEKPGKQAGAGNKASSVITVDSSIEDIDDLVDSKPDNDPSIPSATPRTVTDNPEEYSFNESSNDYDQEPHEDDEEYPHEDPEEVRLSDDHVDQLHRNPNYEEVVSPDFKVKPKPIRKKGTGKSTQSGGESRPTKKSSRTRGNHSSTPPRNYGGTAKTSTALERIEAASKGNVKMLGVPSRRGAKHNWELISKEYIEGVESTDPKDTNRIFYSMRELGDRHAVSDQMVRARAAKERWTEKKEAHAMRLARERIRKRQATLVNKGVDFDDKALQVAELGMGMVTQRLAEIAQEVSRRRKIREEALSRIDAGLPVDKADLYSAVNYREMEGLASAAGRFQEIGMKALGTDVQRHEISGPEGDAIEVKTNIRHEISRDDPERIAAIVSSFEDAGLLDLGTVQDIIDAEIVEDETTGEETSMDASDSTEDEE